MRTVSRVVLFLLGLVSVGPWLAAEMPIPILHRRVTDLTGTLSSVQQDDLENTLADFERKKGSQVAVLIVPTTQPETIEQYSIRVASQWKLGRKGVDDGALLLVAKEDRALRIEVGYGLEGVLPDAICKRIIEEFMVPLFKGGDFAGGIQAGVAKILGIVQGEPLPPPPAADSGGFHLLDGFGIFVLFGVVVLLPRLFGGPFIGSGRGGWTSGGGSGGGLGGGGGFGGGGGGFGGGGASGRW
ncbi:MAG: YgcG family protein [Elusimicrobia bacterium]|nr:YgcG family protein [Elusimicrobiota bacterium]